MSAQIAVRLLGFEPGEGDRRERGIGEGQPCLEQREFVQRFRRQDCPRAVTVRHGVDAVAEQSEGGGETQKMFVREDCHPCRDGCRENPRPPVGSYSETGVGLGLGYADVVDGPRACPSRVDARLPRRSGGGPRESDDAGRCRAVSRSAVNTDCATAMDVQAEFMTDSARDVQPPPPTTTKGLNRKN